GLTCSIMPGKWQSHLTAIHASASTRHLTATTLTPTWRRLCALHPDHNSKHVSTNILGADSILGRLRLMPAICGSGSGSAGEILTATTSLSDAAAASWSSSLTLIQ